MLEEKLPDGPSYSRQQLRVPAHSTNLELNLYYISFEIN